MDALQNTSEKYNMRINTINGRFKTYRHPGTAWWAELELGQSDGDACTVSACAHSACDYHAVAHGNNYSMQDFVVKLQYCNAHKLRHFVTYTRIFHA